MKKYFAALAIAGLLVSGCGNQQPAPKPEQKTEDTKPAFEQAVEPVKDAAENAANDVKDAATNAAADVKDAATDAANAATDAAADVKDAAAQTASDAADVAREIVDFEIPAMISSAPSIGTTREEFETYGDGQYTADYDQSGRVVSMEFNTSTIDNDMLASILPSDVKITSFDTNSSNDTTQINHFQGTSELLKKAVPSSNGRFEAFTNFDKQTSQFLGGTIKVVQ